MPTRIEGVQDAVGPSPMLDAQFTHVGMSGAVNPGTVGKAQMRAARFKQSNRGVNGFLFGLAERVPPITEFIGIFDVPTQRGYASK